MAVRPHRRSSQLSLMLATLLLQWLASGLLTITPLAAQSIDTQSIDAQSIDVSGFRSSIQHWRTLRDESRFIQPQPDQPAYTPDQVHEIVDNILLFQREDGGWPKDYDMLAKLTDEQRKSIVETRSRHDSSYDNGNLHSQVEYLARAVARSTHPDPKWQQACERGFDFMLRSQYDNGGFPQRYPNPSSFHAYITFNDGVMMGIMKVLREAATDQPHFRWLDDQRRVAAARAVDRGIECILRCQIVVDGTKTGWCQQHEQNTLKAAPARSFELASICPQETTDIVRFLMACEKPSTKIVEAIDAAVAWMQRSKLEGIRISKVAAAEEVFLRHTANFDVIVVNDSKAPPLWARHYEIDSNRPIFAGRDGIKHYALVDIERERRTGTVWYGGWPGSLLEKDYPRWQQRQ